MSELILCVVALTKCKILKRIIGAMEASCFSHPSKIFNLPNYCPSHVVVSSLPCCLLVLDLKNDVST